MNETQPDPPDAFKSWGDAIQATRDARERALTDIGALSPMARAKGFLPSFIRGEAQWPASMVPTLRLIHRDGLALLVTDGLSDPFDPDMRQVEQHPEVGCGCELFAETTEAIAAQPGADGVSAPRHWLEWVLW